MRTLGFEKYADNLEIYLKKYREVLKTTEKLVTSAAPGTGGPEAKGKSPEEAVEEEGEEEDEEPEDEEDEDEESKKKTK